MRMLFGEQYIDGVGGRIHISSPQIFVDNEKKGRSGHCGHALAEFDKGKIIAFYSNTSAKRFSGHAAFGWVEYKISEDYGKTWGKEAVLDFSKKEFLDGINTVSVEKAVACDDGSIVIFCLMNSAETVPCYEPYGVPKYLISKDGGKSWSEPFDLLNYRGRVYDAVYKDGAIYALVFCNDAEETFWGSKKEHLYRIYKSDDNGKSFYEHSVVDFPTTFGLAYGSMIFTQKGELIVYAYDKDDEQNMPAMISGDCGKTWREFRKCFVEKKIRNPQVNILDGQYILHGRAGENEAGTGAFVLYTSTNGLDWDKGKILVEGRPASFYSNNLVTSFPDGKNRMLVQYSENYNDPNPGVWSGQVNVMQMWIDSFQNEK